MENKENLIVEESDWMFMLECKWHCCSNDEETAKYTLLSQKEIDQFIQDKNIKPLAIEEVQNSTVILYNNGIYYLSKDNEELIENYSGWGIGHGELQLGMTSTGSPHAFVILNDEALLKESI